MTLTIPEIDMTDRLRISLRHAGLTGRDMAEYLGCARETLSGWLNGKHKPSRPALMLWAQRCEVPLEWLIEGTVRPEGFEPPAYCSVADDACCLDCGACGAWPSCCRHFVVDDLISDLEFWSLVTRASEDVAA